MERARSFALLRMTAFVALVCTPATASAQVGNPPESSPYRDIRKGHAFTATAGYFGGDGGRLNLGPHSGRVFGGRYDIRTGSTIQFGIAVGQGDLERFIVDPSVQFARSGPVKQSVTFAELNLQFNVTGGKSWNRIAPFIAATGGLGFASGTPADTSGYDFGNEFYFAPSVGARVFLSRRLHLRGEARLTFWKLNYPPTLQQVLPEGDRSEWTTSPWIQVGLGYSFSL